METITPVISGLLKLNPHFEDYPALAGAEQFIQQIDLKVSTADEKQTLTIRRHKLVGNK